MVAQKEQTPENIGKLEARITPPGYTLIKLLCIGLGALSILCSFLGILYVYTTVGFTAIISEYSQPVAILAFGCILGIIDLLLWLLFSSTALYPPMLARLKTTETGQNDQAQTSNIQSSTPDPPTGIKDTLQFPSGSLQHPPTIENGEKTTSTQPIDST